MGVIANILPAVTRQIRSDPVGAVPPRPGLVRRLLACLPQRGNAQTRLALVERIVLAPRQTLTLVEADGQRVLIATAHEGSPTFCLLDNSPRHTQRNRCDEVPFEGTVA